MKIAPIAGIPRASLCALFFGVPTMAASEIQHHFGSILAVSLLVLIASNLTTVGQGGNRWWLQLRQLQHTAVPMRGPINGAVAVGWWWPCQLSGNKIAAEAEANNVAYEFVAST